MAATMLPSGYVSLREELARGLAALADAEKRIEVVGKFTVFRGLKVVGRESRNGHNQPGAKRSEYLPEALQNELRQIENIKVNNNHPPKTNVVKERDNEDRIGKLRNARLVEGEIYADLWAISAHPVTPLIEAALSSPEMADLFALSHNAFGKGTVKNGVFVISEVKVLSVDVVTDGGTNTSLLEGLGPMKITLKDYLATQPAEKWPELRKLVTIHEAAGAMLLEAEGDNAGDYRDHLHAAKKMCEDAGDTETAKKIHGLMKPAQEGDEEADEEDAGDDKDDKGAKKGDEDAKKAEESAKKKKPAGMVLLHESEVKQLLKVAKVKETPGLLKVLREAGTTSKALAILDTIQESAPPPPSRGSMPKSAPSASGAGGKLDLKTLRGAFPKN
jgi:hypothetical protein